MTTKVMIGTPCYDGRLDVWYTNSLMNTIKESVEHDVEIIPIWVSFDALLQRARNDTVHLAIETDVDYLIFIDSDIEWQPSDFFKLLNYPEDIVGGTYRKKGDIEEYVVRLLKDSPPMSSTSNLLEVSGLGTGFLKISKAALQYLWDISEPYIDPKDNAEHRMIFDVAIKNHSFHSEDIVVCDKLRNGGFKLWLDTSITCNHIGPYKFTGNYAVWNNISQPIIKKQL